MIVTHSGRFHADEVFAIAMLKRLEKFNPLPIVRSRDSDVIAKAQIVLDVGAQFVPQTLRFDHHQNDFTEARENQIPYATAGMIWRHFAKEILQAEALQADNEIEFAQQWVDEKLIQDLDAVDNGLFSNDPRPSVSLLIALMNQSSDEEELQEIAFYKAIDFASDILQNFISAAVTQAKVVTQLETKLEGLENGIWILDDKISFKDFIRNRPEIQRVVYPRNDEQYGVFCNGNDNHLPQRFRGLREAELNQASNLSDAIFCHKSGFMAVTLSKESALTLARSKD